MILIRRGNEPASLLKFRKKYPEAGYEELGSEELQDIRKQLWEEQGALCAYCMRRIQDPRDVRIEHYEVRHPQNGEYRASDTLNFKVMLGVCYGNSIKPGIKEEDKTCDAHRHNEPLTVNPYDINSIRNINYQSDGMIGSEDVDISNDLQITLNLNCKAVSLPENRKNVLLAAKKEVYKLSKGKSHEVYLSIIAKAYERYRTMEIKTPYSGIVISWLEKELKISG